MSFHVTAALVPRDLSDEDLAGKNAVVIDVLRATTSIVTALRNGALSATPAATPEEALERKAEGVLICGERGGVRCDGFDLGNSPREYHPDAVAGKRLIFTSTNGSRTMEAVKRAREVYLAAFINAGAVAHALVLSGRGVIIACAGDHGRFSLEDTVCAGLIVHRLRQNRAGLETDDEAVAAEILYRAHETRLLSMMEGSVHGKRLIGLGFQQDLAFAAQLDLTGMLPVLRARGFEDGSVN